MSILLTRAPSRPTPPVVALPAAPVASRLGEYCPFPLETDPRRFGLTTSSMRLRAGSVVVRHGRRTSSDTATILLHGAAGSWTTWTPMLTATGQPGAGVEALTDLIVPDLPGWGDSAPAAAEASARDGQDPSIAGIVATIAEIARALGYERWRVVGHSLGGFLALELAATEPAATVSVGLVSATTFAVIDSVRHPVRRFTLLPRYTALLGVMRALAQVDAAGRALVGLLHRAGLLRPLTSPLFARTNAIPPSVITALATEVRPTAFSAASALAGRHDAARSWSRIACPVRAVRGDIDAFVADTDDAGLGEVIRDFLCRIIPGTGHFAHIEKPFDAVAVLFGAVTSAASHG